MFCQIIDDSDWTFTWFRNNQTLDSDSSVSYSENRSVLIITAAAQTHTGSYFCQGRRKTSGVFSKSSDPLHLDVFGQFFFFFFLLFHYPQTHCYKIMFLVMLCLIRKSTSTQPGKESEPWRHVLRRVCYLHLLRPPCHSRMELFLVPQRGYNPGKELRDLSCSFCKSFWRRSVQMHSHKKPTQTIHIRWESSSFSERFWWEDFTAIHISHF